ncbi:bifunctional glycosyltransferase family 2/GtrA family protein [Sinomonas sp. ASV486]|uniref:bifunctional glycosyltransferase family 2/GtrA family protein n=1 Tax=Sinomonas sp. ASV486 TaxID=3051170 RepID=UPI0027DD8365|nr:bifunctional glycosyltransferase family 2/GtrA family protein [Sinomonas sp. ASV486]MDQ4489886.1 bifunctional glycosyltransferase family 2/GtrA family protein [Sinomonas sp. ASV486]
MTLTDPTLTEAAASAPATGTNPATGSGGPIPQAASGVVVHPGFHADTPQLPRLRPGTAIDVGALDAAGIPVLDVTIPVYNEETDLEECVRRLHAHLGRAFEHGFRITIADNASTDGTLRVAERLARELPEVRAVHLERKGRGNALRTVWLASDAPVLAYMDVDLSTDLNALGPLVAPLLSGHSDLAIGTRLARTSRVVRGPKREFVSRSYNFLLHSLMGAGFSDAQCGFKAIRADVAQQLLPHTLDTAWFFDTELLVIAERCGLRCHEVPVDWTDDPNSKVDIVRTALDDLRGMYRLTTDMARGRIPLTELRAALARGPLPAGERLAEAGPRQSLFGQLARFAVIGLVSTLAYAALYVLGREFMDAQASNFVALLITAVANTAANRRFTFGVLGSARLGRHHFEGLIVFAIGWALTAGALMWVHSLTHPATWIELGVLIVANLAATAVKFLLFRHWVFRRRPHPQGVTSRR